jgi:protocatechuate 3,4-dioxygenase, beta subunit
MSRARRRLVGNLVLGVVALRSNGALAAALLPTPRQTEGPFYPDKLPPDTDNDLIIVDDRRTPAAGQITHLSGRILDVGGRPIQGAFVEIWQVDNNGVYLNSADHHARRDANFQGYGRFVTGVSGEYFFRTIKPVPYPGRTPHIHFKVSVRGQRPFTTQCYVRGEPLNARDGVLNSIRDPRARESVIVPFVPLAGGRADELSTRFDIVLGFTPTA